jgi:hypothetical protein
MRTTVIAGLALGALLSAGCQSADVGQPCSLQATVPVSADGGVPADFLESGNTTCDSLICIESPARPNRDNPYCSKPCVSNDDCFQSDTGLICRPVTVEFSFLEKLSPAVQTQYLQLLNCKLPPAGSSDKVINDALQACAQNSSYCATPIQSQ